MKMRRKDYRETSFVRECPSKQDLPINPCPLWALKSRKGEIKECAAPDVMIIIQPQKIESPGKKNNYSPREAWRKQEFKSH